MKVTIFLLQWSWKWSINVMHRNEAYWKLQSSVKTSRSSVLDAATRVASVKAILPHYVAAKQCRKAFQIFDQHQLLFVFTSMDEFRFSKKLPGTSLYYAPEDTETLANRIKCIYWQKKKPKWNKSLHSNQHNVFLEREFKIYIDKNFPFIPLQDETYAQI